MKVEMGRHMTDWQKAGVANAQSQIDRYRVRLDEAKNIAAMAEKSLRSSIERHVAEINEIISGTPVWYSIGELSERDVAVLVKVFNCVGGDPRGPRGVIDRLLRELRLAGVNTEPNPGSSLLRHVGSRDEIILTDTWPEDLK